VLSAHQCACARAHVCVCVCKSAKLKHIWKAARRQYSQELLRHMSKENSYCHFLRVHNPEPAESRTHFHVPFRYDSRGIILSAKSWFPRYYNPSRFDNQNSICNSHSFRLCHILTHILTVSENKVIDRACRHIKRYSLYGVIIADSPLWTRFNDGHSC